MYNTDKILLSSEKIQRRVKQLAKQLDADYKGTFPLLVGILKGSWIFLADLIRYMKLEAEVDFMAISSYGGGTESSGVLKIKKDLSANCVGRDVIVVEDIVDSGRTLALLKNMFAERKAESFAAVSLLSKPSRRVVDIDADYVGFEIPDEFVVGYGMDFDEKYRGLKDLCVLSDDSDCK